MPLLQTILDDLLNRALEEEMGLVVETNNPGYARQQIMDHKKTDERFRSLIIAIPSTENEVFIVKKSVELDP